MKNQQFACLIVLLISIFLACNCLSYASELPKYIDLVVLHTNDIHGHMLPFEYNGEKGVGGVSSRATMIDIIRCADKSNLLLLDAGDVFTRGPLASIYKGEPDIECMNSMQYDVMTIGNNEFKGADGLEGQQIMFDRIKQLKFPVVCANVVRKSNNQLIVPPYVILNRNGVRIGIFGLTAPRVASYPQSEGLMVLDPIETSKKIVAELKDKSDVVIALTHIGYDLDKQLASSVPDIDLIVGGDSHTWLYKPEVVKQSNIEHPFWVGGPVIVQDGEWGRTLGRLRVILRRDGEHDFQVMSYDGELLPVNPAINSDKKTDVILGRYVRPFNRILAECTDIIPASKAPQWLADSYRRIGKTDLGMAVTYVESGIEKGHVTAYNILAVNPYVSGLYTTEISGDSLKKLTTNTSIAISGVNLDTDKNIISIGNKPFSTTASYTVCLENHVFFTAGINPDGARVINESAHKALAEYIAEVKAVTINN